MRKAGQQPSRACLRFARKNFVATRPCVIRFRDGAGKMFPSFSRAPLRPGPIIICECDCRGGLERSARGMHRLRTGFQENLGCIAVALRSGQCLPSLPGMESRAAHCAPRRGTFAAFWPPLALGRRVALSRCRRTRERRLRLGRLQAPIRAWSPRRQQQCDNLKARSISNRR